MKLDFLNVKNAHKIAERLAKLDALQRFSAGKTKNAHSVILDPRDVDGEYDAARLLETSLGGKKIPLTHEHLRAFSKNIKTVQKRYKTGIFPRQIVDLSRQIDKDRANKQIKIGLPAAAHPTPDGLVVRFVTNAGGTTPNVRQHYATVVFAAFDAALAAARGSDKKAAEWLRKQRVKIDCDCGRWRFWYRYLASIGGYNAGRPETGYPKIRNPELSGVACKHLLRVAHEIETSLVVLNFLERAIKKARNADHSHINISITQKKAEKIAAKQADNPTEVGSTTRKRHASREAAARRRAQNAAQLRPPESQHQGKKAATLIRQESQFVAREIRRAESMGVTLSNKQIEALRAHFRRTQQGGK